MLISSDLQWQRSKPELRDLRGAAGARPWELRQCARQDARPTASELHAQRPSVSAGCWQRPRRQDLCRHCAHVTERAILHQWLPAACATRARHSQWRCRMHRRLRPVRDAVRRGDGADVRDHTYTARGRQALASGRRCHVDCVGGALLPQPACRRTHLRRPRL